MKASELHAHLSGYLAQSPANAEAEVVMEHAGLVSGIRGANDAQLLGGQHLLVLLPDGAKEPLGIREVRVQ